MKYFISLFSTFVFINVLFAVNVPNSNLSTLQQVHVLFRHGEKTPDDHRSYYPKDPYVKDSWYPYGSGMLTNNGKLNEYKIGVSLRKRYNEFLGDVYIPDQLYARSTNSRRTKMSLELVLAGLWPPSPVQQWDPALPWQPIPYESYTIDEVLFYPTPCPRYVIEYLKTQLSPDVLKFKRENKDLFKYLSQNTGSTATILTSYALHNVLTAEETFGKKLPDWTKKVYPEFLYNVSLLEYNIMTHNDIMIKLSGGQLLKKIIEDAKVKVKNAQKDGNIFLYSAHDLNVMLLLKALGVFKPHIPPYSSYVLLELHNINNEYGFKIFYQDYSQSEPVLQILPGCDEFCSFDKFIKLTKNHVPYKIGCI